MNYQTLFNRADKWYRLHGKNLKDRKKFFLKLVPNKYYGNAIYKKLAAKSNSLKFYNDNGGTWYTENIKMNILRYQKSDKYKSYRRKYEASYRESHRLQVRYNSWKSMTKPRPVEELDYLLKRMLQ